jgi:hypothetical protein
LESLKTPAMVSVPVPVLTRSPKRVVLPWRVSVLLPSAAMNAALLA